MRSKFSYTAYFLILFMLLTFIGLVAYIVFVFQTSEPPYLDGVPLSLLLLLILGWLFSGEFRSKIIKIRIEDNQVVIRRFGGLAPAKVIPYTEIDGFNTSLLDSNTGAYEYLYLMQGGKKIGKISDFYHQNYDEMKFTIEVYVEDLGFVKFSYWQELKDIFG